jgi:hypothetical protein
MEEPLRYIFISRGTPTYENFYRPQKVYSGERKLITARLLSGKFYVKICYIYIYIPRFLEEPWLGSTGLEGLRETMKDLNQDSRPPGPRFEPGTSQI